MDSLDKRLKRQNRDMIFCTWNVRSLYRAGSLGTVSELLSKYVTFEIHTYTFSKSVLMFTVLFSGQDNHVNIEPEMLFFVFIIQGT
jgi:hypothetical protein